MSNSFRNAVVYFDLHFENLNYEEDEANKNDAEAQERVRYLMSKGNDLTSAVLCLETEALRDFQAKLKAAIPSIGSIVNFGHDGEGDLDCMIPVNSLDEVKALFAFIRANMGGGDDIIYIDSYMEVRGFTFYPEGVNGDRYALGGNSLGNGYPADIDDFLEPENN